MNRKYESTRKLTNDKESNDMYIYISKGRKGKGRKKCGGEQDCVIVMVYAAFFNFPLHMWGECKDRSGILNWVYM